MKNKIFRGIFFVAIFVWLACMVLVMGALYSQYGDQSQLELKNEAYIVSSAVEKLGIDYLKDLSIEDSNRITWIDKDGKVIFDSMVNTGNLDNHKNRPEIAKAIKDGYGEDVRFSDTLSTRNMYSAVKIGDGSIVRISRTQFTILTLFWTMFHPILVVLGITIMVSLFLAANISKKIVKPINEIDLEDPLAADVYEEVKPLVHKIVEQKKELSNQIDKLQVDVDEKTREADFRKEFTANVSHELKTPLTSISGFAEIIKNGIVKEEDIPRFAGKIYDETQRLINLVGDIIKLSQLDEKQIAAKKENLDLLQSCREVLNHLEPIAEEKNVELILEGEHIYVAAVQQILEEIIYNLCENAIKYNKEKGKVTVKVFLENEKPAFSVTDTGIGIPKEELDRVFERFYRVNKSHSKEIGGTGLGLSIVKHGALYHDASIEINSQVGRGTNITILFNKEGEAN